MLHLALGSRFGYFISSRSPQIRDLYYLRTKSGHIFVAVLCTAFYIIRIGYMYGSNNLGTDYILCTVQYSLHVPLGVNTRKLQYTSVQACSVQHKVTLAIPKYILIYILTIINENTSYFFYPSL